MTVAHPLAARPLDFSRLTRLIGALAGVLILLLAFAFIWREVRAESISAFAAALQGWRPLQIAGAALLAALSYLLLAVNEWMGLRWARVGASPSKALLGALTANAVAHNVGFGLVTATATRLRVYAACKMTFVQSGQVTAYAAASFGLGLAALLGGLLATARAGALAQMPLPLHLLRALALAMLAAPLAYIALGATVRRSVTLLGHAISPPGAFAASVQVGVGAIDVLVSGLLVFLLMPAGAVGLPAFLCAYLIATAAGLVSNAPGGVGVFEATMLLLLPQADRAGLLAALLGYRLFYYLVPMALAAGVLLRVDPAARAALARTRRTLLGIAPPAAALLTFGSGALLVLTGSAPIGADRLHWVRSILPLPTLETAHLVSVLTGLVLMTSASGLWRRMQSAHRLSLLLLPLAALAALARGLDFGPAALLLGTFGLLAATGAAFPKPSSLSVDRFKRDWDVAVLLVFAGSVATGLWVYADTPYEARLWTLLGYHADPSRFLRGAAVFALGLATIGLSRLIRGARPHTAPATETELEAIRPLVEASPDTTARLALIGDKQLLVSPAGDAFLMYGRQGRSFIAMGDPVGSETAGRELLWRLKEMADAADSRAVYYQVRADRLPDYLDLGLSLVKLGEEARIPLADFDLSGGPRRSLRQAVNRAEREQLEFRVLQPPQDDRLLDDLEDISDQWLASHGGREKGFSLGRFDRRSLKQETVAVVTHAGRNVAFANVWSGGTVEASVDLMRHFPDAPHGVMDFLFARLMGWAKTQGYAWFNLGLAPLSGFADHRLAPGWHKIGRLVARRAGRIYSFEGLRAYKAKFVPIWTPRYLAAPLGAVPAALLDVTCLLTRRV